MKPHSTWMRPLTKAIIDATDKLMLNEDDLEARANLAWAATLALNGVSAAQLKGDWASPRY